MNKLSELSKPVAWEVKGILCHSEEEAQAIFYDGEPGPLYSQEYVSALLAHIAELEAKLATPVRLPTKYSMKLAGDKSTRAMFSGHNSAINDSADAIRAAGFTVEGDE